MYFVLASAIKHLPWCSLATLKLPLTEPESRRDNADYNAASVPINCIYIYIKYIYIYKYIGPVVGEGCLCTN